jgi:hypothetical protein
MIDGAIKKTVRYLDIRIIIIIEEGYKRVDIKNQFSAENWRILTEVLRHFKPFYTPTARL